MSGLEKSISIPPFFFGGSIFYWKSKILPLLFPLQRGILDAKLFC